VELPAYRFIHVRPLLWPLPCSLACSAATAAVGRCQGSPAAIPPLGPSRPRALLSARPVLSLGRRGLAQKCPGPPGLHPTTARAFFSKPGEASPVGGRSLPVTDTPSRRPLSRGGGPPLVCLSVSFVSRKRRLHSRHLAFLFRRRCIVASQHLEPNQTSLPELSAGR